MNDGPFFCVRICRCGFVVTATTPEASNAGFNLHRFYYLQEVHRSPDWGPEMFQRAQQAHDLQYATSVNSIRRFEKSEWFPAYLQSRRAAV